MRHGEARFAALHCFWVEHWLVQIDLLDRIKAGQYQDRKYGNFHQERVKADRCRCGADKRARHQAKAPQAVRAAHHQLFALLFIKICGDVHAQLKNGQRGPHYGEGDE